MSLVVWLTALFQLHHTGIKTNGKAARAFFVFIFQLHHTGIKTAAVCWCRTGGGSFQLHHTGIKTLLGLLMLPSEEYFNCTIQELKPA